MMHVMETKIRRKSPTRIQKCLGLFMLALAAISGFSLAASCAVKKARSTKSAPSQKPQKSGAPKQPETEPLQGPLAGHTFEVLGPEVLGPAADTPEIAALRESGLLRATVPCDRPGLCTRSEFGVAVGFEVELIRKIAEWGFGVKENILEQDSLEADIAAAVPCDSSGTITGSESRDAHPLLVGPYFYQSDSGWLCFEVRRGGAPVADALGRIVQHFYDTGTFQQVYKNWFPPEAPDIAPLAGDF